MLAEAPSRVLTAWSWWDCPRSGVTVLAGIPNRFRCEFDDALDDYPLQYQLWPVSESDLNPELSFWRLWIEWRERFDSGDDPEPFEEQPGYASLKVALADYREPHADARHAIPEWHLDRDRSFAGRVPQHFVSWTFFKND